MHSGWFARNNVQRVTADLGFWDAKHEASRASYGSGAAGAPVPGQGLWQHWDGGERITTPGAVCPPPACPSVRGLCWISANHQNPAELQARSETAAHECTRAKEPNNSATGGGNLNLSKPFLRLPGWARLNHQRLLKLQEGFFSHAEVGLPSPHPTGGHSSALSLSGDGPCSKAPEGPTHCRFPAYFSGFQQQIKMKLSTGLETQPDSPGPWSRPL